MAGKSRRVSVSLVEVESRVLRALRHELLALRGLIERERIDERARGHLEMIAHVENIIAVKTHTFRGTQER